MATFVALAERRSCQLDTPSEGASGGGDDVSGGVSGGGVSGGVGGGGGGISGVGGVGSGGGGDLVELRVALEALGGARLC